MEEIITNGGLIVSGTALTLLVQSAVKMWTSRNQKNDVGPQPFEVKVNSRYADYKENYDAHENLFARLSQVEKDAVGATTKLDMIIKTVNRIEDKI